MKESRRRQSLDMLRPSPESLGIKAQVGIEPDLELDGNFNSVRSILRDPSMPGTGQNVRFFSREAFKIITPDQSMASDLNNNSQPTIPQGTNTFLDQLNQSNMPSSSTPPSIKRLSPNSKSSRPTVAEIFSPLNSDNSGDAVDYFDAMSNPTAMAPSSDSSNLFEVSQQLNMPSLSPDFNVNTPNFSLDSSANDHNQFLSDGGNNYPNQMTSTPCKPKDLEEVDDSIFHDMEKPPKLPAPLPTKTRTRSMSDTVFQTMLRSSSSQPRQPEADINDESATGLVVYPGSGSEPDPFSAHANTYYAPQTMIPATPPKDISRHVRKTSKEETLIISLQTQLAIRTELCGHYEADLKARDELVEILGKKLADSEKDDTKRKNALRSWKKKVQELERVCRHLEETVEDSKQNSMERSVMDEASSEALRMLHRQIASLEREKNEGLRREHGLREEVETLESLVKDKSEDILSLKEIGRAHV